MEKSDETMMDKLKPILAEIQRLHFSREAEIRRSEQREEMMKIIEKFPVRDNVDDNVYTWEIQKMKT